MEMQDITAMGVEVIIRKDGKVVWINTEEGCVLRISNVSDIEIIDDREEEDG